MCFITTQPVIEKKMVAVNWLSAPDLKNPHSIFRVIFAISWHIFRSQPCGKQSLHPRMGRPQPAGSHLTPACVCSLQFPSCDFSHLFHVLLRKMGAHRAIRLALWHRMICLCYKKLKLNNHLLNSKVVRS